MKIICKSCKGKGHVVDKAMLIFAPGISWIIAYIERDDRDSITRQVCSNCNGKGFIKL